LLHYAAEYPGANHDIICLGQIPVGRIYLARKADELHILDITVLPQHRNAGIGSCVLRRLLHEAGETAKAVTIYIENFSPALSLFRQLEFLPVAERGFHLLLRWSPTP